MAQAPAYHSLFQALKRNPSGKKLVVIDGPATQTLRMQQAGAVVHNLTTGGVTITLPQDSKGIAGAVFEFYVTSSSGSLTVNPGSAGALYVDGAKQSDGTTLASSTIGSHVKVVSDGNGDWMTEHTGTWA